MHRPSAPSALQPIVTRFEKPAPDARAAPPEAHESLISRMTIAKAPMTGRSSKSGDFLHALCFAC
jgi:hypothetical protein